MKHVLEGVIVDQRSSQGRWMVKTDEGDTYSPVGILLKRLEIIPTNHRVRITVEDLGVQRSQLDRAAEAINNSRTDPAVQQSIRHLIEYLRRRDEAEKNL